MPNTDSVQIIITQEDQLNKSKKVKTGVAGNQTCKVLAWAGSGLTTGLQPSSIHLYQPPHSPPVEWAHLLLRKRDEPEHFSLPSAKMAILSPSRSASSLRTCSAQILNCTTVHYFSTILCILFTSISLILHTGTYFSLENCMNNSLWSDEVTKSSRAPVAHQVSNFSFRYLSGQLDTCQVN